MKNTVHWMNWEDARQRSPSAASALLSPSASTLVSAFAAVVLSVLEEPHPVKDAAAIHPASPKAAARLMVALVKMFFLIVFCPPFGSLGGMELVRKNTHLYAHY